jgi:hypothetical protein
VPSPTEDGAGTGAAVEIAINYFGNTAGFYTNAAEANFGFYTQNGKSSDQTAAFGLNDVMQIVGSYVDGSGVSHGFVMSASGSVTTIDDPNGAGGSVLNGINNGGSVVGFYTDSSGSTDGYLAVPSPTPAS